MFSPFSRFFILKYVINTRGNGGPVRRRVVINRDGLTRAQAYLSEILSRKIKLVIYYNHKSGFGTGQLILK